MSITVREAGVEEADVVLRIMQLAFEEYRGKLDPPSGALNETIEDVRRGIASGGAFLALAGDAVVGSARFRLHPCRVAEVRVGVRGSLPSNRRLYEKLGYRLIASRQYENGTDVDLTLAKPLA